MYTRWAPRGHEPGFPISRGKQRLLIVTPCPRPSSPQVYTALFCYQIMTLIDKIVHYIFLLLIRSVFLLLYLGSTVEKSDTFLHIIHPRPFDPYITQKLKLWLTLKLKLWQNLKIQIVTKLKNWNCDKIQNSNWRLTQKLKVWQNSKSQTVIKFRNSNCDKTQIVTKLKT